MARISDGIAESMLGKESRPVARPEPKEEGEGGPTGHLKSLHAEMGGKHMHIHKGEDGTHTSHQIGDSGEVEGPHDHENIEALKEHMDRFLTEEGEEKGEGDGGKQKMPFED